LVVGFCFFFVFFFLVGGSRPPPPPPPPPHTHTHTPSLPCAVLSIKDKMIESTPMCEAVWNALRDEHIALLTDDDDIAGEEVFGEMPRPSAGAAAPAPMEEEEEDLDEL
jgi:hypothetical protein